MRKYAVVSTSIGHDHVGLLPTKLLGHSVDAILAASLYKHGFYGNYLTLHETPSEAMRYITEERHTPPVFELELADDSELRETINLDGELNPFQIASAENLVRIISATHAGHRYDLSEVWEECQNFIQETRKLRTNHYDKTLEGSDLRKAINDLHKKTATAEGTVSYATLTKIYKATNHLLNNPTTDNLKEYKALAKTQQGAPSLAIQIIGVCMLALAAAVATMGVGLLLGAGIALAGCGVFALGRHETGLCKSMNNLALNDSSLACGN